MINELADAGYMLTDKQQVQAVIHSLPYSWDHMKVILTRNEYIKPIEDVKRHLKLEEERQEATKMMSAKVHVSTPNSRNGWELEGQG